MDPLPRVPALVPALAAALAAALPAAAGPGAPEPFAIRVTNRAPLAIACEAEIAHWFSDRLATIPPGAASRIELVRDPGTGTVARVNADGAAMPVERLWCGIAGRAWESRAELPFRDGPATLACRLAGAALACE